MTYFVLRNLELFFKDKTSVILSLLAEVIIMVLYILFMRDNLIESFTIPEDRDLIIDVWMAAGIIGITPLTAATGAYGILVTDKADKRLKDFEISPLSTISYISGYYICAVITAVILALAVLFMAEVYIYVRYGQLAGAGNMSELYGILIVDSFCCAAIMLLPVLFINTGNALAGCCTILGALVGFMTGIYLPVGSVSENVALIVKVFPVSHGVSVFRRLLTEPFILSAFSQDEKTAAKFMEYMGICFKFNGEAVNVKMSVIVMIMTAAVFLSLSIFIRKCMRKR